MKIRIWKPVEKGNPCAEHYYYQFFLRKKRYRGVLEARNLEQAKQAAQKIWDDDEKTGGRLIDVKKALSSARLEAGIPDFQLRDLRHSCATRLSDKGEELVTVAEILGHTDIRMTKRYSHGMHERKRAALEKLVSDPPRQPDAKNVRKEKRQSARPAVST